MALLIRASGSIVCAAFNAPERGDVYLDDAAHYRLSVEMGVLRTDDDGETWRFCAAKESQSPPTTTDSK